MKILAIETSCEHASVALNLDEAVLERVLDGHLKHSERLLPSIYELLAEAQLSLGQLDAVAFGAGPGAFTGLRLACGVAQGLAMGADLGVVPVCSLDALSLQGSGENVLVATDARMREIYTACYHQHDGRSERVTPPACLSPEGFALPADGQWCVVGSALKAYPNLLDAIPPLRISARIDDAVPRARDVGILAKSAVLSGGCQPAELVAPIYVRDKVALTTAERLARGGRA